MKLQTILLLTGLAAGLMTVSCQSSTEAEAEAFYGTSYPKTKKVTTEDEAEARNKADFYTQVNAHIDRRLNEFNEKEEAKLPVFSSKEVRNEFMDLSFIRTAEKISVLSIDFAGPQDVDLNILFDRDSRTLTRTVGDKTETYAFEPFTNGVPPAIPYDAHILYAFANDFNRIADAVSVRSYEKLEKGENPAVADQENAANLDEKGRKKDKNFVEVKPKVTTEPLEFRIDNRWCKCYDVKLKSICAPAVALALYVSDEEKTISRIDILLDDDTKTSFNIDWREQDGIVLPRVIRRLEDNAVFFREDAKIILKSQRFEEEAEAAAKAAEEEVQSTSERNASRDTEEEESIEFDASAGFSSEKDASAEDEDGIDEEEDDAFLED